VKGWGTTSVHKGIPIALTCALALLSGGNIVLAEDQPTETQILDALKARGPARGAHEPAGGRERGSDERQFIEALLKKKPRTITVDDLKADPKLGRAAALRNAMLVYMNDRGSPLNAYPAFWGPFSIIGEGAAR
jgi:hypothetical protein